MSQEEPVTLKLWTMPPEYLRAAEQHMERLYREAEQNRELTCHLREREILDRWTCYVGWLQAILFTLALWRHWS